MHTTTGYYLHKQVELGCVKYVPAAFRVDPYIEVKGQTEVKVMCDMRGHTQWSS